MAPKKLLARRLLSIAMAKRTTIAERTREACSGRPCLPLFRVTMANVTATGTAIRHAAVFDIFGLERISMIRILLTYGKVCLRAA